MNSGKPADPNRLVAVTLDQDSIGSSSRDVEHERAVAIYDLIEDNSFAPAGHTAGLTRCISALPTTDWYSTSSLLTARRWWRTISRSAASARS